MKILVTGAKGFVGRNLCLTLEQMPDIEVLKYDLGDEAKLDAYIAECDFVMHLAGVNRPKDPAEFQAGNAVFTEDILEKLAARSNPPPVLLSSSIQAALDNDYGRSKKAAEDAVMVYGEKTGAPVYVYRLANVFGKWCRPNYNSAVATLVYNIARDLPVMVRDPDATVMLVYIDDVVKSFVGCLDVLTQSSRGAEGGREVFGQDGQDYVNGEPAKDEGCAKGEGVLSVEPAYTRSLGEIVELIRSFHDEPNTLMVPDQMDGFTKKLYSTYLAALPEDKFSYPLTMHCDNRGSFTEALHSAERGQVSVNVSKPGITKGQHWHHTKHEKFLVVSGKGEINFRMADDPAAPVISYKVSGEKLEVVRIPPGYTHNIVNVGDTDLVTVMWANEVFDPENPDTFRMEV
ncbi:MAG: NAD-dependent epimerase/dehydratase family protein [Kiritimatiellae bacterium]|nr:NAD-dependent epimerase/dehydratase family protein [Kiritimatiellia bacterium]